MALGPIELVVIGFPQNRFEGRIIPELQRLVDRDTVTLIDGVFVSKDADGVTTVAELSEVGSNHDVTALSAAMSRVDGLISEEDVQALTSSLEADSSAAVLAYENTWLKPLRDAIVDAGGVLLDSVRIPGPVVDEVLAAIRDDETNET